MCPLYMRCHATILFTCIAVLSCLVVKGGWICEIWIVGTNNKLLGGKRQTRKTQYRRELGKGSVWPEDEARTDVFARSCKKSRSSMSKMYMDNVAIHMERKILGYHEYLYSSLINYCSIHIYAWLFIFIFRLKINHDSHEFIPEFGTIVNSSKDWQ
jgi:hypothetical protein